VALKKDLYPKPYTRKPELALRSLDLIQLLGDLFPPAENLFTAVGNY
jgi:hypothetical protein